MWLRCEVKSLGSEWFQITSDTTWKYDVEIVVQTTSTFGGMVNNQKIKSQHRCHKVYDYEVLRNIKDRWFISL